MKLIYITLLSLAISWCALASPIQNPYNRNHISLNGQWKYIVDPYENGYCNYHSIPYQDYDPENGAAFYNDVVQKDKSHRVEYSFYLAKQMNIPGDWNSQDPSLEFYEGTVWFKKEFTVKKKDGFKYILYFGAANYRADVYLNKKPIGYHEGGFTPFEFDVTNYIKENNSLIVKIENSRKVDRIPALRADWWNYGGITRDVMLIEVPETYVADYKIQLSKTKKNTISGFISINKKANKKVTINIPELQLSKELETINGKVQFELKTERISLWSPNNPKLYDVIITYDKEEIRDKIGFRNISTEGKNLLLNNEEIFLRGICVHEEIPMRQGRAYSKADAITLLTWAKELGCNMVRLSHYPHNEHIIRTADEMGILVWSEVPVYWKIEWESEIIQQKAKNMITEMIERDKNRSSIIIWSIGNETPVSDARNTFMSSLAKHTKATDDTRLVSAALEIHTDDKNPKLFIVEDELGDHLDIISFNEYLGWYGGSAKGAKFQINFDKPAFISETGAGALYGFHGDEQTVWSEEYQARYYREQLEMIDQIEGLCGLSPWLLTDFKSPRRQHPVYQEFFNRKGLISDCGQKKQAFYELHNYYLRKKEQAKVSGQGVWLKKD